MRLANAGRTPIDYKRCRVVFPTTQTSSPKLYNAKLNLSLNYVEHRGNRLYAIFEIEKVRLTGVGETALYFRLPLPKGKTQISDFELGSRVEVKLQYHKLPETDPLTGEKIALIKAEIVR